METYAIGSSPLTYDLIERILRDGTQLVLSDEAVAQIRHCREFLDRKTDTNTVPIYGVTTGFGSLCNKHISPEDLTTLQENLVKSHSCSVGTPVAPEVVKLMLLLKAHALSMGFSGVQVETVQRILDFYNNDILPVVYD
ncbi:MAG: aromatic amino acid ammonia-lyase, partial [Muribaculaceae bacterium]|nr:aromatic amino acid ammonia-lyase [Muribaculaceae bacterium]